MKKNWRLKSNRNAMYPLGDFMSDKKQIEKFIKKARALKQPPKKTRKQVLQDYLHIRDSKSTQSEGVKPTT